MIMMLRVNIKCYCSECRNCVGTVGVDVMMLPTQALAFLYAGFHELTFPTFVYVQVISVCRVLNKHDPHSSSTTPHSLLNLLGY